MSEEPKYKIEVFEGPLDLLLSLIMKNKVEISDIPISLILEQYMEYLDQMREMDMEIASEFIVMAADLMLIKSRMLLPKPPKEEDEEDPRAELARALEEYKRAKEAAKYLGEQYMHYAGRIVKESEIFDVSKEPPESADISLLNKAFMHLLKRNHDIPRLAKESERMVGELLKARIVPVGEMVIGVMRLLYKNGDMRFEDVMLTASSRSALIAMFVGILELMKVQRVKIIEEEDGGIILHLDREKRKIKTAAVNEHN